MDDDKPDDHQQSQHRVAIAFGSNLGDSREILRSALKVLAQTPGLVLEQRSHLYRTPPVGPPQPDYLNACAIFSTTLEPISLLHRLLEIEQRFGRVRRERWGPRLLDLDLILYDDLIMASPRLQIPHPRMMERAFVLIPLAEIAPDWVEPASGKAIATLAQAVSAEGIERLEGCDFGFYSAGDKIDRGSGRAGFQSPDRRLQADATEQA